MPRELKGLHVRVRVFFTLRKAQWVTAPLEQILVSITRVEHKKTRKPKSQK